MSQANYPSSKLNLIIKPSKSNKFLFVKTKYKSYKFKHEKQSSIQNLGYTTPQASAKSWYKIQWGEYKLYNTKLSIR